MGQPPTLLLAGDTGHWALQASPRGFDSVALVREE